MRHDSVELPYLRPMHYHVVNFQGKTFWDLADTLNWIKKHIQLPEPQEERKGVFVIKMPFNSITFIKCDGSKAESTQATNYDQLLKSVGGLKLDKV